ncbi:MAG TPA: response regulator [Candidatus Aquilonibacter sp.]|nr:response regulator [Candidatus Aquilonibacter sp.]
MVASEISSAVFVVDDDASIRDSVRSLLKSMGIHAEVFGSTAEFMNATRPDVPSCLVLDVRLPGMNGLDFQNALENAGIHIPIIFITAHGDIPMTLRAMKAGAVEFLAKPFQKDELLAAIDVALARDRVRLQEQAEFSALQSRIEKLASRERDVAFDIAVLNKMASRLSAADPLHQVLDEVVEFVVAVVECDSCMVYVMEGDELVLRASKNPHPEAIDRLAMRVGQGITGWVAEHRKPVAVAQNAFEDFRFKLFNELPEDRFQAFLSVPLVSGGHLVGVINLQNRAPHQYTQREIGLVTAIGFLVGAEVERARLETEKTELSDRLETRKLIERAKGVLQRDLKIGETEAYRIMQRESQQRRKSMKELAESIILNDDLKRSSRS